MGERLKTTGNGKSLLLRAELQGTSPRRDVQKIWGEWGNPLLRDHMDAAVRWYLITCTSQMMNKLNSFPGAAVLKPMQSPCSLLLAGSIQTSNCFHLGKAALP